MDDASHFPNRSTKKALQSARTLVFPHSLFAAGQRSMWMVVRIYLWSLKPFTMACEWSTQPAQASSVVSWRFDSRPRPRHRCRSESQCLCNLRYTSMINWRLHIQWALIIQTLYTHANTIKRNTRTTHKTRIIGAATFFEWIIHNMRPRRTQRVSC